MVKLSSQTVNEVLSTSVSSSVNGDDSTLDITEKSED